MHFPVYSLKTLNVKILPIMKGYAHDDKALTSQQNSGSMYSEVNC